MSLPDFLIIGAMKSGTTTLQAQLAAQTGVFMTTPKEPNFFSDDDIHARGLDWYRSLFAQAQPDDIRGEASTHYTKRPVLPHTLERMSGVLTAPKFIYMIRNPVDRAISHYIHAWSARDVDGDLEAALEHHREIIDFGRYGMQLSPFAEAYGLENIWLTSLEQIRADPQGELTRIGDFLGTPADLVWQSDLGAQNVSADRMRQIPLKRILLANPVARALRRWLVPKNLRDRVRKARTMGARPQLTPDRESELIDIYLDDRAVLARMFPDHPALRLSYPFAP